MNVLSLFDGISCGQVALQRSKIKVDNYFASEIDSNAIKVTQHNFSNTIQLGDVTKIQSSSLPKIDLLMGGYIEEVMVGIKMTYLFITNFPL